MFGHEGTVQTQSIQKGFLAVPRPPKPSWSSLAFPTHFYKTALGYNITDGQGDPSPSLSEQYRFATGNREDGATDLFQKQEREEALEDTIFAAPCSTSISVLWSH